MGSEPKVTLEVQYQIWNDDTGCHHEVGPDRDGLDLLEIRYYDESGTRGAYLTFHHDEMRKLHDAIGRLLASLEPPDAD